MPEEPPLGSIVLPLLLLLGRELGFCMPPGLPPHKALHWGDPALSHFRPQGDLHARWLCSFSPYCPGLLVQGLGTPSLCR